MKEQDYSDSSWCEVCREPASKNSVLCGSEYCSATRLLLHEIIREYTPSKGCDACWSDSGTCTEKCNEEFRRGHKLARELWRLVHLAVKDPDEFLRL